MIFQITVLIAMLVEGQLNKAILAVEKQVRSTWHGPPDDPLPPEL